MRFRVWIITILMLSLICASSAQTPGSFEGLSVGSVNILTGTPNVLSVDPFRSGEKGSEVQIPIYAKNVKDMANMDLVFFYNVVTSCEKLKELYNSQKVIGSDGKIATFPEYYTPNHCSQESGNGVGAPLKLKRVDKGSLTQNTLFASNSEHIGDKYQEKDIIRISFVSSDGISGDGSLAILAFDVLKDTIELTINTQGEKKSVPASTAYGVPIEKTKAKTVSGESVTIAPESELLGFFVSTAKVKGDADGDGKYSTNDVLSCLQVAVKKEVDITGGKLTCDVNNDGTVDSSDARDILKQSVSNQEGGQKAMTELASQAGLNLNRQDRVAVNPGTMPNRCQNCAMPITIP